MVMIEVTEAQASVLSYLVAEKMQQQRVALNSAEAANINSEGSRAYRTGLKASIAELQVMSRVISEAVG